MPEVDQVTHRFNIAPPPSSSSSSSFQPLNKPSSPYPLPKINIELPPLPQSLSASPRHSSDEMGFHSSNQHLPSLPNQIMQQSESQMNAPASSSEKQQYQQHSKISIATINNPSSPDNGTSSPLLDSPSTNDAATPPTYGAPSSTSSSSALIPQESASTAIAPVAPTNTSITTASTTAPSTPIISPKPRNTHSSRQSGSSSARSSWVWKFFIQLPETPFRVQCQFTLPNSDTICGVVLTRDKTGSTGSMCRHLNRVHQLVPSSPFPNNSNSSANTASNNHDQQSATPSTSSKKGASKSADNKRSFDSTSENQNTDTPNKRLKSPTSASPYQPEATSSSTTTKSKSRAKSGSKAHASISTPGNIIANGHNSTTANTPTTVKSKDPTSKFTTEYILNNILPYFIETGIVFYEPGFHRFQAHLLSTLSIPVLPVELQSFTNFCIYAQARYQNVRQSIRDELKTARGLISLCCGIWKSEGSNATPSTKHIEQNMILIISARYVDDNWTLRRLLLKMIPIRWYTTSVVRLIQDTAIDFEISGRIFTIGIDGSQHLLNKSVYKNNRFQRFMDKKLYPDSLIPVNSLYHGLDEELGQLQFDCGVDRRNLVFQSLVAIVSKAVDDFVYDPEKDILPIVMELERVADELSDALPLRQQLDKINIISDEPKTGDDGANCTITKFSNNGSGRRKSERKSTRSYDDEDEDYDYFMKLYDPEGEFNNCNKDDDDELAGWRSVYILMKNAVANWDQVSKYCDFQEADVILLKSIVEILTPIFTTISDLQISCYDTAGVTAFAIETMNKNVAGIITNLKKEYPEIIVNNVAIAELADKLEKTQQDIIQNNLLFRCIEVMDPNFKRIYWHVDSKTQKSISETLRKGVLWVNDNKRKRNLLELRKQKNQQNQPQQQKLSEAVNNENVENNNLKQEDLLERDDEENVKWSDILPSSVTLEKTTIKEITKTNAVEEEDDETNEEPGFFRNLVSKEKPMDSVELEISEYLLLHTSKKFVDPYQWWKTKGQIQFPQLSKLALTYLAIAGWNTVIHNQQLYEGSAILPCTRRRGRQQVVVRSYENGNNSSTTSASNSNGTNGVTGGAMLLSPTVKISEPTPATVAGALMKLNKEALAQAHHHQQGSDNGGSESNNTFNKTNNNPLSPSLSPNNSNNNKVRKEEVTVDGNHSVTVLERIRPEQEMCLRYWSRYYR